MSVEIGSGPLATGELWRVFGTRGSPDPSRKSRIFNNLEYTIQPNGRYLPRRPIVSARLGGQDAIVVLVERAAAMIATRPTNAFSLADERIEAQNRCRSLNHVPGETP